MDFYYQIIIIIYYVIYTIGYFETKLSPLSRF